MRIQFHCPACEQLSESRDCESEGVVRCSACGWRRAVPEECLAGEGPQSCMVCGKGDLWRQKDFSQRLGLCIVALGAVLSSIAWYYERPLAAMGVLMLFALADVILFAVMPDVLVCYRCRARHRGAEAADHAAFDHELAERYRQERLRLEQSGPAPAR